jgi:hypothetical protein
MEMVNEQKKDSLPFDESKLQWTPKQKKKFRRKIIAAVCPQIEADLNFMLRSSVSSYKDFLYR